jgi:hypothetical protein
MHVRLRYKLCKMHWESELPSRLFKHSPALMLTTVLSEAWKPIALFGHARGTSVFFEPGIAGPRDLLRLTLDLASRSEIVLDPRS